MNEMGVSKMNRINDNYATRAILIASAAFSCGGAAAQDRPTSGAESTGPQTGVQEIVVTAQRRSESLQRVPIAVTAIAGDALEAAGIQNTSELSLVTPGLNVTSSIGYVLPRIRGVGTAANAAGVENPVATYVDGVYYASQPSSLLSLNNIAQVAVVKGPQGTLFGRNATGGVIQITTKDPVHEFGGEAALGYGNYETAVGSLYVTAPIVDALAADLAVRLETQGKGWGENVHDGRDIYKLDSDVAIRSKWLYAPTDATQVKAIVDYAATRGSRAALGPVSPELGVNVFGPFYLGGYDVNQDLDPRTEFDSRGLSVDIQHDFSIARFVSISAFRRSQLSIDVDFDLTPNPLISVNPILEKDRQFTQELQLLSLDNSAVKWVAGVFYMDSTAKYDPYRILLGGPLAAPLGDIDTLGTQKTKSYAGYGQATAEIVRATNLTVGLRYTDETRDYRGSLFGYLPGGIPIGPLIPEVNASKSFGELTWRLALDHRFNDDMLVYASYNRGFKSGGFNVGSPVQPAYNPEVLDAYEIGSKTELAHGAVRLNTAVFFYDYSNIQVPFYDNGSTIVYNGAAAQIYGMDADLTWAATDRLDLTAGVSVLHDRFTDFPNADTYVANPPNIGGFTIVKASAKGHRLPQTPDATFNLSANYTAQIGGNDLKLNLTYSYNDGWHPEPDNIFRQKSFNMVNASATWTTAKGVYWKFWGANLLDERVKLAFNHSPSGAAYSYDAPRTYGATLGYKF